MFPEPSGPKRHVTRVPCVGAVVHDDRRRLLLVRRGRPPALGRWSLPGGRVEPLEDDAAAVRREVLEETGLHVVVGAWLGTVQRPGAEGVVYDIRDYACELAVVTTPLAGDDAAAVRWVGADDLALLPLTDGLMECLTEWGMLPR